MIFSNIIVSNFFILKIILFLILLEIRKQVIEAYPGIIVKTISIFLVMAILNTFADTRYSVFKILVLKIPVFWRVLKVYAYKHNKTNSQPINYKMLIFLFV